MSKKEEAKWYEVLEPSYIGDRLYRAGEEVQYEGEAGPNLKLLSAKEAKARLNEAEEPDDSDLDAREQELNKRESEIALREKDVDARQQELDDLKEKADLRSEELDQREKDVADKEKLIVTVDANGAVTDVKQPEKKK